MYKSVLSKSLKNILQNEDIVMMIILPNKVDGLSNLQNNFSWEILANAERWNKDIELYLPRFKIEFTVDLKNILQKVLIIHFMCHIFEKIIFQLYFIF